MKIRVAPWIPILLIALGVVAIVGGILLLGEPGGAVPLILAGVVLAAFGGLYYGPLYYCLIGDDAVLARLGFGVRRFEFGPRDTLRVDRDGNLLIRRKGQPEHLPVNRRYAHRGDWEQLTRTLERRDGRVS